MHMYGLHRPHPRRRDVRTLAKRLDLPPLYPKLSADCSAGTTGKVGAPPPRRRIASTSLVSPFQQPTPSIAVKPSSPPKPPKTGKSSCFTPEDAVDSEAEGGWARRNATHAGRRARPCGSVHRGCAKTRLTARQQPCAQVRPSAPEARADLGRHPGEGADDDTRYQSIRLGVPTEQKCPPYARRMPAETGSDEGALHCEEPAA